MKKSNFLHVDTNFLHLDTNIRMGMVINVCHHSSQKNLKLTASHKGFNGKKLVFAVFI